MNYISLSNNRTRLLTFYLAAEEYVARYREEDDCFFLWQVEPTVIFGRNQDIENEVNIGYCRKHNIHMFRRKSGGGCVYADMTNIMFSYINSGDKVVSTFDKYMQMIVNLLHNLGVDATYSEHNDIMIGNKKVSGNAFYHIPGRNIVHGTMLYDTNMDNMIGSITPDDEKLRSHGVKSVRQRITLLKEYIGLNIEEFKEYTRKNLCDKEIVLGNDEIKIIEEIEQEYLKPQFIFGDCYEKLAEHNDQKQI